MALYNPDRVASNTWVEPAVEAFRTQRDVGLLIPINYLISPAVSLRAACFGSNQYEDFSFQKCVSNLLAVGFRKFIVDVYWDAGRSEWSLCPAEIPPAASSTPTPTPSPTPASTPTPTSSPLASSPAPSPTGGNSTLRRRQEESLSMPLSSTSSTPTSTASSTSPSTPLPSLPNFRTDNNPLLSIGSFNCTSTMTLSFLTGILEAFLDQTSTTTDASFVVFLLNIHAASSWASPDDPAQQPPSERLPAVGNLISDIIKGNLSEELYTAQKLEDQRANLGNSWYNVDDDNRPALGYYRVSQDSSGRQSTEDGWPTEAFLEFQEHFRMIAGFSTIDPQMANYNLTTDLDTIYSPGILRYDTNVSINTDGTISSGCLFSPNEHSITTSTNSSWTLATAPVVNIGDNPKSFTPIPAVTNLTSCGLSPLINTTISNTTADKAPLPYAAFVQSTLWSWSPGEPQNATTTSTTQNRCAVMDVAAPHSGRWRTADCNERHRVACQDPSTPYTWTLSSTSLRYLDAGTACPSPLTFSVPHTALENAHLLSNASSSNTKPIFLNLNSLDVEGCWVASINGTCPYIPTADTDAGRVVVVPTVAAVIIFVLAALTFFVKCAANRREDKRGRRRRMVGGWEYEGVPS
ncbi:hypothetical protein K458DRAFT_367697 [Lentithecium fluviatile CBS 122367]|uniref:Maintenance of telomere capping protein 6 n=1 Tax=Lentithecium fluviatile CBS 122367 TaxID=1168545 RepID=A0A6G1J101_9PLEO|nr:hypothetical protein K458DRAFT_367697 [Lentithecium fluviatile CBS 122367]